MVRLEHVNKYFNRRKKNEIHVINDTTLQMENKGLVALLGPSGCGKTTLLNVIGGLDKIGSGNIYINGEKLNGRRAGKIDQIRNLNVGYIFQNYNLVDNMTVFDNVAIALKMVGVKDKKRSRRKLITFWTKWVCTGIATGMPICSPEEKGRESALPVRSSRIQPL